MADAGDDIAQYILNNKDKLWRAILWSFRKAKEFSNEEFILENFKSLDQACIRAEALSVGANATVFVVEQPGVEGEQSWNLHISANDHMKLSNPQIASEVSKLMNQYVNDAELIPVLVDKWQKDSFDFANKVHDASVENTVVVWNKQEGTLNFYSDGLDHSNEGIVIECSQNLEIPEWIKEKGLCDNVKSVRFDETLQFCEPRSCDSWFKDFKKLEKIEGIEYLELKECVDTSSMFENCESLRNVDLRVVHAENIKQVENMFRGCKAIEEIDFNKFNTDIIARQLNTVGLETLENCKKIGFLQDTVGQDILRSVPENIKPVFYCKDFDPQKFQKEVQKEAREVSQKAQDVKSKTRSHGDKETLGKNGYKIPGEDIGTR